MQKYGVSNNSGSRMICAPRAAASRTSFSALAMLPARSQSQRICVAATVTWRGPRRKCAGSVDIEDFAGIEDAAVDRAPSFNSAHSGNFGRRYARGQDRRLTLEADAVLGRDGAGDAAQRLIDTALDLGERRGVASASPTHTEMCRLPSATCPNTNVLEPGTHSHHCAPHRIQVYRHLRDGQAHVEAEPTVR